jgi:enoyl-CoA hydratase/carnithine racemase
MNDVAEDRYRDIELRIDDPVAVLRLNRPEKLNAFTYDTLAEIRSAITTAAADPKVVGIVITGNGRGFCAGLDAQTLAAVTSEGGARRRVESRQGIAGGPAAPVSSPVTTSGGVGDPLPKEDELPGLFTYLLEVPKPIIAAVNGVAAGGGVVLASMCDVRFASTAASFTTIFLKRGLVAEHGTTWILPRLMSPGRALDLLWTSDRIDGETAHRIGLVEHLTEPSELVERACDYVRRIAASASPASVADTKRMVYRHLGVGYPEALREADRVQWAAVGRPDAAEGAKALLERREPRFRRLGEASPAPPITPRGTPRLGAND